jgi:hypothetical protein
MKVHMLPTVALALPDAGFGEGLGVGAAVGEFALVEANIRDDGDVAHHADFRCDHRGLFVQFGAGADVEIEVVELQAFHQSAVGFGFKGSDRWVAQLLISGPIASSDAIEQHLGEFQNIGVWVHDWSPEFLVVLRGDVAVSGDGKYCKGVMLTGLGFQPDGQVRDPTHRHQIIARR